MRSLFASTAMIALMATPAIAGEEVLYSDTPEWVERVTVDFDSRPADSPIVLLDQQARIEKGQLWTYTENAFALDTPEALTQWGTLSAAWLPDKGDLFVHNIELVRDGAVIDLLKDGARFDVLRREQLLEARMLDGQLTATMPLKGAQVGDVVRLAYSTTVRDQAMGDEVQFVAPLVTDPFPLYKGQVKVSWPEDLAIVPHGVGKFAVSEVASANGYKVWQMDLPLEELDPRPGDAPFRFQLPPIIQIGTYANWQEVSRTMAPHYDVAGAIEPGGDLAAQVAAIAAKTSDPKLRMADALRLVQDQISYLLNGLNGGNYLPQMPEETWEKRFGDCKAKSVLLHAILSELGVQSEVVLVNSSVGDALPQMAPMPANFDHMIVRAEIDGVNYWLDGTSLGTRLDTIDNVPRFYYALPLRAGGADLVRLDQRFQTNPDQYLTIRLDQSAGIRVPALFDITYELRGVHGARWQGVAEQSDDDSLSDAVAGAVAGALGDAPLTDYAVNYDADSGIATITASGIFSSPWKRDRQIYELDIPGEAARDVQFSADRARADWREIPLRLNGPTYFSSDFELLLPGKAADYALEGSSELEAVIGGVEVSSKAKVEGQTLAVTQTMRSLLEELPASEISNARRALTRFHRQLPVLKSGTQIRQRWEYMGKDRALLAPLEAAYARIIADADADESEPYLNRARFLTGIYDYASALADFDKAIAIEASANAHWYRALARRETGDLEGALADLRTYEELRPGGGTYEEQVTLLALLGRKDDALALAEEFRGLGDNAREEEQLLAAAMGWQSKEDAEEGLLLLEDQLALRPGDGETANAICWHAAVYDLMTVERFATCEEAVDKGDFAPAVLDSRAFANFRLGRYEAALTDIDAVLLARPELTESRILKVAVLKALGAKSVTGEDALGPAMSPYLARLYRAYGLDI